MSIFTVKQTKAGFLFNLVADNDEIIATSEVYTTKANCLNGIESVKTNAPKTPVEDQTAKDDKTETNPKYEVFADKAGKIRFRPQAVNGAIIAAKGFDVKDDCLKIVEVVRTRAAAAAIAE